MHFEGREIPTYGVFVPASELVVGQIYFRLAFLDDDMAIPELIPSVFIGRDLDGEDEPGLFFQDVSSFLAGERYDPVKWSSSADAADVAPIAEDVCRASVTVEPTDDNLHVCEYERALDQLLACSLRRQKWDGQARVIRAHRRS